MSPLDFKSGSLKLFHPQEPQLLKDLPVPRRPFISIVFFLYDSHFGLLLTSLKLSFLLPSTFLQWERFGALLSIILHFFSMCCRLTIPRLCPVNAKHIYGSLKPVVTFLWLLSVGNQMWTEHKFPVRLHLHLDLTNIHACRSFCRWYRRALSSAWMRNIACVHKLAHCVVVCAVTPTDRLSPGYGPGSPVT